MAGYVINTARAPGRAASVVTQRKGSYSGKGILTAELLAGFVLVLIRVVADYEVQEDGTVKGNVGHPSGQYGPLPILTGLIITFFFLSFLAVSGGTKAKLAGIMGGCIILALGVKSYSEIETVGKTFGSIGSVSSSGTSGTENASSAASQAALAAAGAAAAGTGTSTSTKSSATGNALSAAERAAANFIDNFGTDFTGSFDLANPGVIISSTENQWTDFVKTLADLANAGNDASDSVIKKVASWIKGLF